MTGVFLQIRVIRGTVLVSPDLDQTLATVRVGDTLVVPTAG